MGEGVLTSGFTRTEGGLACEGIPLERIAREVGTPTYVYSSAMVRDRFVRLDEALADVPHRIHYTLKANSNAGLLRLLKELGAGVDVVSGGELFRALRLGFTGDDMVFGGVGKTDKELREAVQAGVKLVNAESEAEVRALDRIAREEGLTARVGLRVNPEVTVDSSHRYIKTGERGAKFGIPFDEVLDVARVAASLPNVALHGLDMHIGSQLFRIDPYVDGVERLTGLLDAIRSEGIDTLRYLDIGGGLGVSYSDEVSPDLGRFAITQDERDREVFRVPSLRNVELTPPYFHDGRAATLADAVRTMGKVQLNRDLDPGETDAIVQFLRTLTGEFGGRPLTSTAQNAPSQP